MLIRNHAEVIHKYHVRVDFGRPTRRTLLVENQEYHVRQLYRADISFGTNGFQVDETFNPEKRGLRRPFLLTNGLVSETIKTDIENTWTVTEWTKHIGKQSGLDGTCAGIGVGAVAYATPIALKGIGVFALKMGLAASVSWVPGVNVVFGLAAAKTMYGAYYVGSHAVSLGAAAGATTGVVSGTQEYAHLSSAEKQDLHVYTIIKLVDELEAGKGYVKDRITEITFRARNIRLQLQKEGTSKNPAAWQALRELNQWLIDYAVEYQGE